MRRRPSTCSPDNPDVIDTYGWALHHAGRHEEALLRLQEAFRLRPDMYCIHYHLGAVYLSLAQPQLAQAHFCRQISFIGTREAGMASAALSNMGPSATRCLPAQVQTR